MTLADAVSRFLSEAYRHASEDEANVLRLLSGLDPDAPLSTLQPSLISHSFCREYLDREFAAGPSAEGDYERHAKAIAAVRLFLDSVKREADLGDIRGFHEALDEASFTIPRAIEIATALRESRSTRGG